MTDGAREHTSVAYTPFFVTIDFSASFKQYTPPYTALSLREEGKWVWLQRVTINIIPAKGLGYLPYSKYGIKEGGVTEPAQTIQEQLCASEALRIINNY